MTVIGFKYPKDRVAISTSGAVTPVESIVRGMWLRVNSGTIVGPLSLSQRFRETGGAVSATEEQPSGGRIEFASGSLIALNSGEVIIGGINFATPYGSQPYADAWVSAIDDVEFASGDWVGGLHATSQFTDDFETGNAGPDATPTHGNYDDTGAGGIYDLIPGWTHSHDHNAARAFEAPPQHGYGDFGLAMQRAFVTGCGGAYALAGSRENNSVTKLGLTGSDEIPGSATLWKYTMGVKFKFAIDPVNAYMLGASSAFHATTPSWSKIMRLYDWHNRRADAHYFDGFGLSMAAYVMGQILLVGNRGGTHLIHAYMRDNNVNSVSANGGTLPRIPAPPPLTYGTAPVLPDAVVSPDPISISTGLVPQWNTIESLVQVYNVFT